MKYSQRRNSNRNTRVRSAEAFIGPDLRERHRRAASAPEEEVGQLAWKADLVGAHGAVVVAGCVVPDDRVSAVDYDVFAACDGAAAAGETTGGVGANAADGGAFVGLRGGDAGHDCQEEGGGEEVGVLHFRSGVVVVVCVEGRAFCWCREYLLQETFRDGGGGGGGGGSCRNLGKFVFVL